MVVAAAPSYTCSAARGGKPSTGRDHSHACEQTGRIRALAPFLEHGDKGIEGGGIRMAEAVAWGAADEKLAMRGVPGLAIRRRED